MRVKYQDIEEHYYDIKQSACGRVACTVMIMVAYEVDAMASVKMLTQLLRNDNIAYTIRPVLNWKQIEYAYKSFLTTDIKTIFMINCGATFNIPKLFGLEKGGDVRCFILDNHRPLHLSNIYSRYAVVVFDDENEIHLTERYDILPSDGSDLSSNGDEVHPDQSSDEDVDDDEEDVDVESNENVTEEGDNDEAKDGDGDEEEFDVENDKTVDILNAVLENYDSKDAVEEDIAVENDDEDVGNKKRKNLDETIVEEYQTDEMDPEEVDTKRIKTKRIPSSEGYVSESQSEDEEDLVDEEVEDPVDEEDEDRSENGLHGSVNLDQTLRYDDEGDNEDEIEDEGFDEQNIHDEDERKGRGKDDEGEEEEDDIKIIRKKKKEFKDSKTVRKQRLQSYYKQNASYTAPTALMMMQLVCGRLGSHVPTEMIWQAILGVTDQMNRGHIEIVAYQEYCAALKRQLLDHLLTASDRVKYSVGNGDAEVNVPGSETGHIEESFEYRLYLYRHWSLLDAMSHSPYIASKLSVWQSHGALKLQELLARIGMPLQQCRQSFQFMAPQLRNHFRNLIKDPNIIETYHLENPEIIYKSFTRYYSFRSPVAAVDLVCAANALLEMYGSEDRPIERSLSSKLVDDDETNKENFQHDKLMQNNINHDTHDEVQPVSSKKVSSIDAFNTAYDCISMQNEDLMKSGIQTSISLQKIIVKKASVMLDGSDSILRFNRLYYAYVRRAVKSNGFQSNQMKSEGNGMMKLEDEGDVEQAFSRPFVLQQLGQFIMDVKRNLPKKDGGWTGSSLLPFIILSERVNTYIVVGISPLLTSLANGGNLIQGNETTTAEHEKKLYPLTNFKQFFKLAAEDINANYRNHSFDTNIIEIDKNDALDFLGTLDYLLKKATPYYHRANLGAT